MEAPVTASPLLAAASEVGRRERAPGKLRLVQDFVNTLDLEAGSDELANEEALGAWLSSHDLLPAGVAVEQADVARSRALREAVRRLLLAHHSAPGDPGALAVVNRAASEAQLAPRFTEIDSYRLEPQARGVSGALGWIVAAVSESIDAGTWSRLKACRNDECQWAFYDSSRNRSGSWCSMAVCGNRMKVRAYRRRHREERTSGQPSV